MKNAKMDFQPLLEYTHYPARWAAPVQVYGPTAGARGWETLGGYAGRSARPQGARGEAARSAGAARYEGPG